jgi:hypothetical protein
MSAHPLIAELSNPLADLLNTITTAVQASWGIALLGLKQAILQPAILVFCFSVGVVAILCRLHVGARRKSRLRRRAFLTQGENLRYASVEIVSLTVQADFLSVEQHLMSLETDEVEDALPAIPPDNCRRYVLDLKIRPKDGYFPRWEPSALRLLTYEAVHQLPKLDEMPPWGTEHHLCLIESGGKYFAHRRLPAIGGMKVRLCFDAKRVVRTLWLSYYSENLGPVALDTASLPRCFEMNEQ